MIGIILIGILLIGVVGSAAYSMLLMVEQSQAMIRALTERQTFAQAETIVINSLRPLGENQKLIAPLGFYDGSDISPVDGTPDVDYQQLPKTYGIKTKNAYGIEIVYCPISDEMSSISLPSENIAIDDTSEYSAKYVEDHLGIKYAYQTDFTQHSSYSSREVLAFLISRRPGSSASCSDVTYNGNKYIAPAASVKAITRDSILTYQANQPILIKASDYDSSLSFNGLSSSWESTRPLRFIINLDDGNDRNLTEDIYFINQFPGENKEIYIKGQGSGNTEISNSSGNSINFENVSVHIEGITFGSNLTININSSKLITNDVILSGKINADNSTWTLKGNLAINSRSNGNIVKLNNSEFNQNGFSITAVSSPHNGNPFYLNNSKYISNGGNGAFTTKADSNSEAILAEIDSKLIINNSSFTFNSNSGSSSDRSIFIDESSYLIADNSNLNLTNRGNKFIQVNGFANIIDTNLNIQTNLSQAAIQADGGQVKLVNTDIIPSAPMTINYGIEMVNGGTLKLQDSNIGTSSRQLILGVFDNGGRHISGTNSNIYSPIGCWIGVIFNSVPSSTSGNSRPIDLSYRIFNQSNWNCN